MDITLSNIELKDIKHTPDIFSSENIPTAISDQKNKAFQEFISKGFPEAKNEEYKYTNFTGILKDNFSIQPSGNISQNEIAPYLYDIDGFKLVFVNGRLSKDLSEYQGSEEFFDVCNFSEADPSYLKEYFDRKASDPSDGFTLLNTAMAENGAFIIFKKNKITPKPVLLYFITDTKKGKAFVLPRNLIIGLENSQATLIQSFHTIGEEVGFNNIVNEVVLKDNALIETSTIQNDNDKSIQVNNTFVHQDGKSNFIANTITINGALVRNNLNIILKTPYSESELYGLYLLKDKAHVDNHTLVDHAIPNCLSNEYYKGILDNTSTGVFNGKIYVRKDAQKTNAFQSNKNILLSKEATMNTKPQLEIFADDVKCSHGATIGQLDEDPLFYLRARGIKEETAKRLLVMAFAQDVIDHIKDDSLRDILTVLITKRLS